MTQSNETTRRSAIDLKAVPNETKLLVVDTPTDEYYKKINMLVKGSMSNVLIRSSEDQVPVLPEVNGNHIQETVAPVVDNEDRTDGRRIKSSSSRSSTSSVEKVS